MAKHRKSRSSGSSFDSKSRKTENSSSGASSTTQRQKNKTFFKWLFCGPVWGFKWLMVYVFTGSALGFLVGTGWIVPGRTVVDDSAFTWRHHVARSLRSTKPFQFVTFQGPYWDSAWTKFNKWAARVERDVAVDEYRLNPANNRIFAVLREAVIRENGGFVYPDLGMLHPAPSGSVRGIGMVSDTFYECQSMCFPNTEEERRKEQLDRVAGKKTSYDDDTAKFPQEDVLIRVPLTFQMNRKKALETLLPLLGKAESFRQANLEQLDDAAVLVLYLAHERGVGKFSRWLPYIASLPPEPTCGYSRNLRHVMLDAIEAYRVELGVDTEGWGAQLRKAMLYGEQVAQGLNSDFGSYLKTPEGMTSLENIQWALCQVASRATAGSGKHGSLRLVPMLDLVNHDADAGGFVELHGKERKSNGDVVDANEDDSGTFIVRSLRHGRRKPLKKGQELLANYNVPQYSPLDWIVSLGFLPSERWSQWQKMDPVLPRIRQDEAFASDEEQHWKNRDARLMKHLQTAEL